MGLQPYTYKWGFPWGYNPLILTIHEVPTGHPRERSKTLVSDSGFSSTSPFPFIFWTPTWVAQVRKISSLRCGLDGWSSQKFGTSHEFWAQSLQLTDLTAANAPENRPKGPKSKGFIFQPYILCGGMLRSVYFGGIMTIWPAPTWISCFVFCFAL